MEGKEGEENFDRACEVFINVINYASTQPNIPFMSVKVTGFARFALLEKMDEMMHAEQGTLMKDTLPCWRSYLWTKEKNGTGFATG